MHPHPGTMGKKSQESANSYWSLLRCQGPATPWENNLETQSRAKTSGFLDAIPSTFRLWGGQFSVWGLSGLQNGPIFGQKLTAQSAQLLLEFLQCLVFFLLAPKHVVLVIVDVQVHPVIHHSHHTLFGNERVIKDLGAGREGRDWPRRMCSARRSARTVL